MKTLEFFYDIASPYAYLASTRVEALAADTGSTLLWRPVLLGGIFKEVGNAPPAMLPARGRYMLDDLKRWAAYYGVPFEMPPSFPPNTLVAMRALTAIEAGDERVAATHALYRAYWAEGRNVTDPAVVASVVGPGPVEAASDPAIKQALREAVGEAVGRGAFGTPTFFVDGDTMFFGNDRLPFVEQALRAP